VSDIPELKNVSNLKRLHMTKLDPPDWIFENFMKKGDQVLLSGRTGEGKSLVTMLMAVSIAKGQPFGNLIVPKPMKALILDAENDMYGISLRIQKVESFDDLDNIKYWWGSEDPDYTLNLCDPLDQQIILKFIRDNDIDIVIFDNVFALTYMEDYMSTQEYQAHIKPLVLELKKQKVTGIYLHHLNKKDEEYGSIGMKLFMDLCIKLTKEQDEKNKYFQFLISKARAYGIEEEDLSFMVTEQNEVVPYVAEVVEGGKQHYLTYLKNNWHKVDGGQRKKIAQLTEEFKDKFEFKADISQHTVRTSYAKNW